MLTFLYLAGGAAFGSGVSRRAFRSSDEPLALVAHAIVIGWMTTVVATYALARLRGDLTIGVVVAVTVSTWIAAILLWSRDRRPITGRLPRADAIGLSLVLALFVPIVWTLFSSHTFASGSGGTYSGGSAWYDLSFHAALTSSFAYGGNFPPSYPALSGEPLLYPWLPDFHAATLIVAGASMRTVFLATALPLVCALLIVFYAFARRIAGSAVAAALACGLFLLNGGFGFALLPGDWRASGRSLPAFWQTLTVNYTNDWDRGFHWVNITTDILLPQRAAVYGLPAAIVVLMVFADEWSSADARSTPPLSSRWLPLCAAGVVTGMLPYFHTHSYIAVGFISVCLFLLRPRTQWIAFWIPALLLASPQLIALGRHAAGEAIVRLQPGWMGAGTPSVSVYLLRNLGLSLVLAVPAWLTAPKEWRLFYLPFVALLVAALTVVVSPNVFDNGKLTYYWHVVNSALIARWLVGLATARRWRFVTAPLMMLLTLACIASGVTAVQAEAHASRLLYSDADVAAAQFVRESTAPDALFLTASTFNHAVLSLAGRSIVRGPTDWLWAHGYDFHSRQADVMRIYGGGPEAQALLERYAVQYVFIGPAERTELHANHAFFDARYPAVYRTSDVSIFAIRPDGSKPGGRWHRPAAMEFAARVDRDPDAFIDHFDDVGWPVFQLLRDRRGRAPDRQEYVDAMKVAGRGLVLGAPEWRDTLNRNLRELRERAHGESPRDGDEIIRQADRGPDRRAYVEAWVLVHYFGFLRRNAADAPDHDLTGYRFWVDVTMRTHDYRSVTRAFMSSDEYTRTWQ